MYDLNAAKKHFDGVLKEIREFGPTEQWHRSNLLYVIERVYGRAN